MDFLVDFMIDYAGTLIPYLAIFGYLLACGLGVPIPEDIGLIVAGIGCYYGVCDVWTMIAVCLIGVLVGDSFMFILGSIFGRKLLKRWPFRVFIDETKISSIRTKLHGHGGKLLFTARFTPGLRSTVFFATGLLHFPYRKLLIYDGAAAIISVPTIVYSVYFFGDFLEHVIKWIKRAEGGVAMLILAVLLFFGGKYWLKHRKKVKAA